MKNSAAEPFWVGVDGCRKCWLAVRLTPAGAFEFNIFSHISALWQFDRKAALILIDIPIGFLERGPDPRTCDREARRLLRKRASSVFPVPCRAAIYAKDYDEAITTNERLTGKRIFRAAWNIVPRMREVDELLLSDKAARGRIREGHPEVCFWALAGGRPMQFKKKSEAGFAERREVLQAAYPPVEAIIAAGLDWLKGKAAGRDDLLDALAAAVTGLLGKERLSTLPDPPPLDARGLPMEMVYYLF